MFNNIDNIAEKELKISLEDGKVGKVDLINFSSLMWLIIMTLLTVIKTSLLWIIHKNYS